MKKAIRLFGVLVGVVASTVAAAAPGQASEGSHAVFVQTNDSEGNGIAVYHRSADGTLTYASTYATGGLGGRAAGSGSDPLASQGSLVLVPDQEVLLAVNAGSNTISVFEVNGDQLRLQQVLPSGGQFPVGFAVRGNLVYVLNAGGQGSVSGYRLGEGKVHPIGNSTRTLGLGNTTPPFFLKSPAQVGFTPDGDHLIVTTKTLNTVHVFSVGDGGRLSAEPTVNAAAGVPFAFLFDRAGRLVLNFAANSSLQTFTVNADNTITAVTSAAGDGQAAACWLTLARGFDYASNTGSGSLSQFRIKADGTPVLVNGTAATGIPGAVDSAVAGHFLYVQSGMSASVHAFRVAGDGSLTRIQIASVPDGDDQEGMAAS